MPRIFGRVHVPSVVCEELTHSSAPEAVRAWVNAKPGWLEVSEAGAVEDPSLVALDDGERAAIAVGLSLKADLLLTDDRRAVAAARARGFEVVGTLGILDPGGRRGMVDLASALTQLRNANFRRRAELFDALLKQHQGRE